MDTILLVEDDFEFASFVGGLLEAEGIYVIHETSAEQAVEVLRESNVDLVITDMVMSDSTGNATYLAGLTVISFITLNEAISPKIIAISGTDWATSPFAALRPDSVTSPLRVLEKPIDTNLLLEKVRELLAERKKEVAQEEKEAEVQRALLRTRRALETTPEAIMWISITGDILYANESACDRTQYTAAELENMAITDLDASGQTVEEHLQLHLPGIRDGKGYRYETIFRKQDGSTFLAEIAGHLLTFDDEQFISLFVRDITERKREEAILAAAKSAVEESERRFRSLANSALPLFWVTEIDSKCSWLNQRWLDYCGKTLDEQIGEQWLTTIHPDDRKSTSDSFLDATNRQTDFSCAYRLQRHDGVYRWFIANGSPRFDEANQFLGLVGISFDDHERRESQIALEESQANLRVTVDNLEAVNQELEHFAYVASHDLKQPLRGIFHCVSFLNEDLADILPDESKKHLEMIGVQTQRLNSLLDDLLHYARSGRTPCQPEELRLSEVIDSVREILSPPIGLDVQYVGEDLTVFLPRIELEQILRNLVGNAIKHHDTQKGLVQVDAQLMDGRVHFDVIDDGPGIPIKHHARVFEIYQKLKSRDEVEGSGMGLSIVRKLIESRGGTIAVESEEGQGATFRFSLPLPV
jgi:PAS domain S-box-containing protein